MTFKALPAHQVSCNICRRHSDQSSAIVGAQQGVGFHHVRTAVTLPASSSCKVRSIWSTVPDMFCAVFCSCWTGRAPERTERSCCLPERPARASMLTIDAVRPPRIAISGCKWLTQGIHGILKASRRLISKSMTLDAASAQPKLHQAQPKLSPSAGLMACQCLSGRVLPTVDCDKPLARRPLRLLTHARSQTSACTRTDSVRSNQGHFLGSCRAVAPFQRVCSQSGRQQHRIVTQAYNQKPDIADRVVASVPYLIPLCDGLRYGE